jgi:hypothetical protein
MTDEVHTSLRLKTQVLAYQKYEVEDIQNVFQKEDSAAAIISASNIN